MKKISVLPIIFLLLATFSAADAVNRKLSGRLADLIQKNNKFGLSKAISMAGRNGITVEDNDKVTVVLEFGAGKDMKQDSLKPYRGEVKGKYRNLIKARIPISQLEKVADDFGDVDHIRLPLKPYPVAAVTSQGVGLTGAGIFQNKGFLGNGTKVAIIDAGFYRYLDARTNGDLPASVIARDYTGLGVDEEPPSLQYPNKQGTAHGTAVAEIVYDMAPSAQIYLMRIQDDVDLGNAKDDCKALGVDIVNHSIVWFNSGPGDGTGSICDIANDAYDSGILWVNSAGNSGQRHWEGAFKDSNGNGRHEFLGTDEKNTINAIPGYYIDICMRWDDTWNGATQDYDLWLLDSNGVPVAQSENAQSGPGCYPTEELSYLVTTAGNYDVVVVTHSVTRACNIELFSVSDNLKYSVAAGSILEPADSLKVLAVGAISQANWTAGPQEIFSSIGPANNGAVKPDIAGPDGVRSFIYGSGFYGTSAASPHVAGAACLLLGVNRSYTTAQLWQKLEQDALDLGTPGKDNTYGAGKLNVTGNPPKGPLNTRCEGKTNPVGLTVLNPRFSWLFNDTDPIPSQTAYQLIVAVNWNNINSNIPDTWNTGKVSTAGNNSTYGGPALLRGTTYFWKARTWDEYDSIGAYCGAQSFQLRDSTPPAAVADLSASTGTVDGSVLLSWTAPGDDGTVGSFSGMYFVQSSTFNSANNWKKASAQVIISTGNVVPGRAQKYNVRGLTPRVTYYLCLWTADESGNASAKSNNPRAVANAIPSAPDNFDGVGVSTCGIKWNWRDTYNYEDGFYVLDFSRRKLKTLPRNTTYWVEISTNFAANTCYARIVAPYAPGGVTESATGYAYTLSNPPSALTTVAQTPHTVSLQWTPGPGGNTRYAVDMSANGVVWLSSNTKTWSSAISQPEYAYGPPLYHMTTYWFRVWGYNGDGIKTGSPTNAIQACTARVMNTIYTPSTGGTEVAANGKTKVDISTGAFINNGYVVINLDPLTNPLGVNFKQINAADGKINIRRKVYNSATEFVVYDLYGMRSAMDFAGSNDVMITVTYADENNDGVVDRTNPLMPGIFEDTLKLYVLNEAQEAWEEVPDQTLDTAGNLVTAHVSHFSLYILLGEAPATGLGKIAVYPNPCGVSAPGVTFVNLTMESRVRIYNMAGEIVADLQNSEQTITKVWDLTSKDGVKVVPGIYVYLVTDWMYKGDKAVGQLAVIP
jgi:hypothetical protein